MSTHPDGPGPGSGEDDDVEDDELFSPEDPSVGSEISEDSSDDAQDEDGDLHPPTRSQSSLALGLSNSFAPPFYNRPPTPLPPSPSLTSLLRPPFSSTPSRPSTPDSSDVETPNETEAAVAKSARTATTVPRVSPKVPTYEYYGFVLYLVSSLAFLIYLLWSYLPSPFLHQLGIYYYPDRWWSLALPAYLVMLVVYIYVALASYNTTYLTLPMTSIENIVDDAAKVATTAPLHHKKARGQKLSREDFKTMDQDTNIDWTQLWNQGTDAVMDVPIGGVCEILYGQGRLHDDSSHVDQHECGE
ncbi:MAG: hypothetical protein M1823_003534 [Watsoniomyces obsoletus]|nr:MAG: hypothetical protein M1823_003534 [Watsoniomyces obsoletus]